MWGCEDLRSTTCKRSKVTRAIRLAGYSDKTLDWDVALLSIDPPAAVTPIAILRAADMCPLDGAAPCEPPEALIGPGTEVTAAGWGVTQEGGWQTSPKLLKVKLELISWTECRGAYPDLTDRMVCADEAKKGSCQGDSGGPMMVLTPNGHRLAGNVSFGVGCAREDWPGVYGNLVAMSQQIDLCQAMLESP